MYYDGTKLLSLKDLDGKKPEIFISTSNRSAGKTTWFSRYIVKRFIDNGEKFMLVYRFNYELSDIGDKFFKEIKQLFFPNYDMESKARAKGVYHDLILTNNVSGKISHCGYAVSLNNADQLKKMSHLFSDVTRIMMDEFQSETNHYCADEVRKFISLHTTVARGDGKQIRYVPVYMLGNYVSLLNPYYVEMGISDRLQSSTKFLKGHGFVLEQGFNITASEKQRASRFNTAFSENKYVEYSADRVYLNDNLAFIEKPTGISRYICTIRYNDKDYAVRSYPDQGVIFCDDNADNTYPIKLVLSTADHNINYVMLKQNDMFIQSLRSYFEKGCFRFKNAQCKQTILQICCYR